MCHDGRKLRDKNDTKEWTTSNNKNRQIEMVLSRLELDQENITHVYLMQCKADPPDCGRTITVKKYMLYRSVENM